MYYFKLAVSAIFLIAAWIAFVFFTAFYGWWMQPIASAGDTEEFFGKATEIIERENSGNVAFVLIDDGTIAKEYYSNSKDSIDKDTVFSTASMSKWLTAHGVMKLVQDRKIELDNPVSTYLNRWNFPPGKFDNDEVTVRHLLSHTAGLNDGLGFGDYDADETIPSLEESLTDPRASSDRTVEIIVSAKPGSVWNYSGGGFLILQLVIEEVSGMRFEQFMQEEFFNPLDMSRTTYQYIGDIENNAGSYDRDGAAAPVYKYASSAATGFATSASDLSKFLLSQIPNSETADLLNSDTLQSMRAPHGRQSGIDVWGLGTILYSPTPNGDFVFGHDGANDPAINSAARINPDNNAAIIVLETGHPSLATEIGSQWVLWQTGYPDVLNSDSIIQSMMMPGLLGIIALLLIAVYLGLKHYRQPHGKQD
jgi:CubicO group peptidase (beta-lactamase class C family)